MANKKMIVHTLWVGEELPRLAYLSLESFVKHGFQVNLFCYNNLKAPKGVKIKRADSIMVEEEIFSYTAGHFNLGSTCAFSNMFRYKVVYKLGGYWSDLDIIVLKPFSFKEDLVFVEQGHNPDYPPHYSDTIVASCFFGAKKVGEKIFKDCYNKIKVLDKSKLRHGDIGPDLLTTMVKKYKYSSYPKNLINPIDWWEEEKLFDWDISHSTVAVHCWNSRLDHNKRDISKLCRIIETI
jgi:hypothetical protein